jgi:hypothetical protein
VTKKSAALDLLALAKSIHDNSTDEDRSFWVTWLLGTARGLNPMIHEHPYYMTLLVDDVETREMKLRRLIEHPDTPTVEREAAVQALQRVRAKT